MNRTAGPAGRVLARRVMPALVPALVVFVAACQSSSQSPRLKSEYIGRSTAEFFAAYGPPAEVIAYKQKIKSDSTGLNVQQQDPKELVYYWTSNNQKTYSKVPTPAKDTCNLALLTTAEGKILLIEVQDEGGNITAVKAACEAQIK
ncbi:hypothetical protein [Roseibium sp. M-1]